MQSLASKTSTFTRSALRFIVPAIIARAWRRSSRAVMLYIANKRQSRFGLYRLAGVVMAYGLVVAGIAFLFVSDVRPVATAMRGLDNALHRSGLGVELHLTGAQMTDTLTVRDVVVGGGVKSLLGVDVHQARKKVEALPWVKTAQVRKTYPQRLQVSVSEKKPFAVWQLGQELWVVERSGEIIAPLVAGTFSELPLLVGAGADLAAEDFVRIMEDYPRLRPKVGAYVRVAKRRWDLNLVNGLVIKLPANDAQRALLELSELDRVHGLLDRDVEVIDYRLPDRVALRLSQGADERRLAAISQRMELVKKRMNARGARL